MCSADAFCSSLEDPEESDNNVTFYNDITLNSNVTNDTSYSHVNRVKRDLQTENMTSENLTSENCENSTCAVNGSATEDPAERHPSNHTPMYWIRIMEIKCQSWDERELIFRAFPCKVRTF